MRVHAVRSHERWKPGHEPTHWPVRKAVTLLLLLPWRLSVPAAHLPCGMQRGGVATGDRVRCLCPLTWHASRGWVSVGPVVSVSTRLWSTEWLIMRAQL